MYLSTANFLHYFQRAYKQKSLAHFYVVSSEELASSKQLVKEFLLSLHSGTVSVSESEILHPDLNWVETEEENFKLEELNEAFKSASYRPYQLHYRFYVIDHAGKVSERLFNKLLKTLEEPEGFNVYLLLKHQHSNLLPTIKSRSLEIFLYKDAAALPGEIKHGSLQQIFAEQLKLSALGAKAEELARSLENFLGNKRTDEAFLATISEHPQLEDILFQSVLTYLTQDNLPYLPHSDLRIKDYLEHKKFNLNREQRVLQLLSGLTLKT